LALPELAYAKTTFVYASDDDEVQTYLLIEDLLSIGKTVAVPRVTDIDGGQMEAVTIDSLKDLVPDAFGILAPRKGKLLSGSPDLSFVPGVAFHPETGVRLGRGQGFYDRYLQRHPDTLCVGLAYETQCSEHLVADSHDKPMDLLITELGVKRFKTAEV
jgi:5-formyltetrahydrofolate cyclo-ligase